MKPVTPILGLVAVLALVAAACGGDDEVLPPRTQVTTTTTTSTSTTTTTTSTTTSTTLAPTTTTTPGDTTSTSVITAALQVVPQITSVTDATLPYELNIQAPRLINHPDIDVQTAINDLMSASVDATTDEFVASALEIGDEHGKSFLDIRYAVTFLRSGWLSVHLNFTSFSSGAAHPVSFVDAFVFDVDTGARLTLAELLDADADLAELGTLIAQQIADDHYEGAIDEVWAFVDSPSALVSLGHYWLSDDTLGVSFDQYAVTPGVLGAVFVRIDHDDIDHMWNPDGPLDDL